MNPYKDYNKAKKRRTSTKLQTYSFLAGENKETNKRTKEMLIKSKPFGRKAIQL